MCRHRLFLFCTLLVFLNWQQACSGSTVLNAEQVVAAALEIHENSKNVETMFDVENSELLDKLAAVSSGIQKMSRDNATLGELNDERFKLSDKINSFLNKISTINQYYEDFMTMKNDFTDRTALEETIKGIVNPFNSRIKNKVNDMYRTLINAGTGSDNIINILKNSPLQKLTCSTSQQSTQQLLYDIYKVAATADTKYLLMILYSWDMLENFHNLKYENERNFAIERFNKSITMAFHEIFEAMHRASRQVWKCDSSNPLEDARTYLKLSPILQTYLLYQTDTVDKVWSAFWHSCEVYNDERLNCHSDICTGQPVNRRCTGHIRDCQYISSTIEVCHSPDGTGRRYDWMVTEEKVIYGKNTSGCENYVQKVGSALSVHTCACTCESEDRLVNRYVSLKPELSDVDDNKVVTGVRFRRSSFVLHLQIQQATMGERGRIAGIPEWKTVNEITSNELLSNNVSTKHKNEFGQWVVFKGNNNLVYTVAYNRSRLYLGDVRVDPGHVVTGVQFTERDGGVVLSVHQTPFNYATGKLDTFTAESPFFPRRKINRPSATAAAAGGKDRQPNFVDFRRSDLKTDLGQTVVPFVDALDVTLASPLPLEGIGLFHKGDEDTAEFVAPKIIHYDLTKLYLDGADNTAEINEA